jgi:hypothetical protein
MSDGKLRRPTERACERCDRAERWDPDAEAWRVVVDDEPAVGNPHCIHEWDINGAFVPFEDDGDSAEV